MDLIYMNAEKVDQGVMKDFTLDLAFGADENDFECVVVQENHCCESGFYLYYEGAEYGGIIDDIGVDTEAGEVTYSGRTWHGILESKVLEPDAGEDYLIVSGEANAVMAALVERMNLSELFKASADNSGIVISNYKMNRYVTGYSGIKKMLKSVGAKLKLSFRNGFAVLSAEPLVDYSKDEQFDTDHIAFKIKKKGNPINHVICLGKGDLAEREVIHVYADSSGNIGDIQTLTGIHEVTAIYENTNAENSEELRKGGVELIQESWNSNEIDFDFEGDTEFYDIGDIVGAKEIETGIEVAAEITKKIVTMNKSGLCVDYSCMVEKHTSNISGGSSGGFSGETSWDAITGKPETFPPASHKHSVLYSTSEHRAAMQPDGNFVVYDGNNKALWDLVSQNATNNKVKEMDYIVSSRGNALADANNGEIGVLQYIDGNTANGVGTSAYLETIGTFTGFKFQVAKILFNNTIKFRCYDTNKWFEWDTIAKQSNVDAINNNLAGSKIVCGYTTVTTSASGDFSFEHGGNFNGAYVVMACPSFASTYHYVLSCNGKNAAYGILTYYDGRTVPNTETSFYWVAIGKA